MCGIIGSFGDQSDKELDVSILRHRGPDGADVAQVANVQLGHTRLAIVDVEGGQQPLHTPDGRYWLISNGEIYNHQQIRQRYPDYAFQTDSDAEVILPLFVEYGVKAVEHLDGMFAFALYDTHADSFYLARDPIGIKPLYFGFKGDVLHFSSEIKGIQHQVDDLKEFPPGHWYTADDGLQAYYRLAEAGQPQGDPPSLDDIRQQLTEAVRKRLMSDVPVGVYLSGGLDSTIIAALVAREMPGVHSFAVGVEGSEDLKNARVAARALGTHHHEYIYTVDEMLAALPEIIYYLESFDPSLVRSAIPNYFLARMTRKYVTVVLTGEGADELYAGYHYLKSISDPADLNDELRVLISTLYNCNLQRCDRMTMAHSIEGRVPFLDTSFIDLSLRVPMEQKIEAEQGIEKWALRKAFEDLIPASVAWRVKSQFSQGAGSSGMIEQIAETRITDAAFAAEREQIAAAHGIDITSKEMLFYYREFARYFKPAVRHLVKVWRGRDVA